MAVAASSNGTLCFRKFNLAFFGSHSIFMVLLYRNLKIHATKNRTKGSGVETQQAGLSLLCELFYPPLSPLNLLVAYLTAPSHLKA